MGQVGSAVGALRPSARTRDGASVAYGLPIRSTAVGGPCNCEKGLIADLALCRGKVVLRNGGADCARVGTEKNEAATRSG
jgi:hypothetical protein